MSTKLYVANLPFDVTEDDLRNLFSQQGPVNEIAIIRDKATRRSRGFGFVTMNTPEAAKAATLGLNGKDWNGRALTVKERSLAKNLAAAAPEAGVRAGIHPDRTGSRVAHQSWKAGASPLANKPAKTGNDAERQRFETILSRDTFQGLKAILDKVSSGTEALWAIVNGANSYEELVARMGYKVTLTKQIHVQDCYSRLGPAGGIKAVLPYHDIPTHSSFPTLLNFDSTLTMTPRAVAFFNEMFAELKRHLSAQL